MQCSAYKESDIQQRLPLQGGGLHQTVVSAPQQTIPHHPQQSFSLLSPTGTSL